MHLSSLIDMVASGLSDRPLMGGRDSALSGAQVAQFARAAARGLDGYDAVVFVGENDSLLPVALLAASCADVPFVPLNYRLADDALNGLISAWPNALVLADGPTLGRIKSHDSIREHHAWLSEVSDQTEWGTRLARDDDSTAVVLYTSGTTSAPKAVHLRHRHLMAYLLGSSSFGGADADESVLISVPSYHIAGIANMLSNLFAGRRIVFLRRFEPRDWVATVRRESISHAMVVPTMLARIVDQLESSGNTDLPSLRHLSYGGAKISERVLRKALLLLPNVDFVNAYGLTETASTVAVLSPEDHRLAVNSIDPLISRRLQSVGRPAPSIEVQIRADDGTVLTAPTEGIVFVRGQQVSGEYSTGSDLDASGWFCTRDLGHLDQDGYLFIAGRADDTIIRGGENVAPAEIETVLLNYPGVRDACVIGVPDEEWGQRIVAVVVPERGQKLDGDDLKAVVRSNLRGSKTPDTVIFKEELPRTDTGKVLRRSVLAEVVSAGLRND